MKYNKLLIIIFAIVFLQACGDTDLENLSNPDQSQVLATSDDYTTVLDGGALSFWNSLHNSSPYANLGVAADHITSSWGNFGMQDVGTVGTPYGLGDHSAINNNVTYSYRAFLETSYEGLNATVSAANDILGIIDNVTDTESQNQLKAYAYFVRGLGYGYLGLLFDRALIVEAGADPNAESVSLQSIRPTFKWNYYKWVCNIL